LCERLPHQEILLAEPDPGPTPFLVEQLIADKAITAIYGPAKAGKTWLALELACAVASGGLALGAFEIPEPGPVIVVLEESGKAALWRRLDMLVRGNTQTPGALRDLHVAAKVACASTTRGGRRRSSRPPRRSDRGG
jgi:RecA-family ATPase